MKEYVKTTRPYEGAMEKREYVCSRFNSARLNGCSPDDIENVLVINSASRSGSSLLYHLISGHPDVISLNGENSVFEKLHGICPVTSERESDLSAAKTDSAALARAACDILRDAGVLSRNGAPFPSQNLLADSVQRLILQHAEKDFDPAAVHRICSDALNSAAPAKEFNRFEYWRRVMTEVDKRVFGIRPEDYDMGIASAGAAGAPPPFSEICLEEPPFVVPRPRIFPARAELRGKSLLLKSSSDCYRMGLVKKMFPRARFKFVLLYRNPAAAVNGLLEGWLSGGFHSRNTAGIKDLDIKGYSLGDSEWTRKWWKFDLPPGWAGYAGKPLEEVCAFQWLSANEHILSDTENGVIAEKIAVNYESLLNREKRQAALGGILDFAGLRRGFQAFGTVPSVMSVTAPGAGKWKKRREAIEAVISCERIKNTAGRLGYDFKDREQWT